MQGRVVKSGSELWWLKVAATGTLETILIEVATFVPDASVAGVCHALDRGPRCRR